MRAWYPLYMCMRCILGTYVFPRILRAVSKSLQDYMYIRMKQKGAVQAYSLVAS